MKTILLKRCLTSSEKYYKILEINSNASSEEIKNAYKKLAKKYHPDTSQILDKNLASEKFKLIHEAKTFLLNKKDEPNVSARQPPPPQSYESYEDFRNTRYEDFRNARYEDFTKTRRNKARSEYDYNSSRESSNSYFHERKAYTDEWVRRQQEETNFTSRTSEKQSTIKFSSIAVGISTIFVFYMLEIKDSEERKRNLEPIHTPGRYIDMIRHYYKTKPMPNSQSQLKETVTQEATPKPIRTAYRPTVQVLEKSSDMPDFKLQIKQEIPQAKVNSHARRRTGNHQHLVEIDGEIYRKVYGYDYMGKLLETAVPEDILRRREAESRAAQEKKLKESLARKSQSEKDEPVMKYHNNLRNHNDSSNKHTWKVEDYLPPKSKYRVTLFTYKGRYRPHHSLILLGSNLGDGSLFKCNTCEKVITRRFLIDHVKQREPQL